MNLANQVMCVSRATFLRTKAPPAKEVDRWLWEQKQIAKSSKPLTSFFNRKCYGKQNIVDPDKGQV